MPTCNPQPKKMTQKKKKKSILKRAIDLKINHFLSSIDTWYCLLVYTYWYEVSMVVLMEAVYTRCALPYTDNTRVIR